MRLFLIFHFALLTFLSFFLPKQIYAITDPLSVPNNKFGIHIIQATPDESSPAATLVNTNGDWGYITVLVESKDRNHNKWQEFFNDLRRRHLIPLIRLATQPEGNFWKTPYEGEEEAWAGFLDALNWPTKNRYVIIYNEPNHAAEWGNKVDAYFYAKVLDKTITALKSKNQDFFVLNAGLDASAPSNHPKFEDQATFMRQMNEAVPGIFEKLDGWVSHSYPNPEFSGSPDASGRGTVRTYEWEAQQLKNLGVNKNLPIFITETGWKHAEGLKYDSRFPNAETVAQYFTQAFANAWNNSQIAAVTPFLLSYQQTPFDQFSFKKPAHENQIEKILSIGGSEDSGQEKYYPMYQVLQNFPKVSGKPIQEARAELTKGEIYSSIVAKETYTINLTFKNIGQSIWNENEQIRLIFTEGGSALGIANVDLPKGGKIEPGGEYTFKLNLKAPQSGTYKVSFNLYEGKKEFESKPTEFTTQVKSPVILKIKGGLEWKNNFKGNYYLTIKGATGIRVQSIALNESGLSEEIEEKLLLPDYSFDFFLEKSYYKSSKLRQKVYAGENILDFGILQPDILSAALNPKQLWQLLPFSN